MAILFITHKFPPGVGGMEKQSYELLSGMRTQCKMYTIIQASTESKLVFFLLLFFRISRILKAHPGIKIIHCNDAVVASVCSFFINKKRVIKTATFHGLDIVFPNVIYQKWVVPRLLEFDRIFAVSEATAQACIDRGFSPDQVRVIKNGVDHELAATKRDPNFTKQIWDQYGIDLKRHRLLLSVGRAVKRKGFSWFVGKVMPEMPDNVRYVVIGPTQYKQTLVRIMLPKSLIQQWDLFLGRPSDSLDLQEAADGDKRCLMLGAVSYETLKQWMIHADLFIMPNQRVHGDMEGFGLVALEAGLSGTYSVASGIEGIRCAIQHEQNGTLLQTSDPKEWVNQLKSELSNLRHNVEKGDSSRIYVMNQFKWSTMVEQYADAFEHLEQKTQQNTATCLSTARL